jgi:uncharacterized membrane protein YtjA (UPF0391 family)
MEAILFSGAVVSLVVALLAAIVSFGGLRNAGAAATAWYVYIIAMGLFVVIAIAAILDPELPDDIRAFFARGVKGRSRAANRTRHAAQADDVN